MTTRNRTTLNQPRAGEPPASIAGADELLRVLRDIAGIPLWGEAIPDDQLRAELTAAGEYDAKLDEYEPSADSEGSTLRETVEQARAAIAKLPS